MKRIIITMGDPAGVGPEVSLKALAADRLIRQETLIAGSYAILLRAAEQLNLNSGLKLKRLTEVADFERDAINILDVIPLEPNQIPIGQVSALAGDAAYRYLERAIKLALAGEVGPIVTAPLNKEALHLGGHPFDGHTEILAKLTDTQDYAMMLWSEKLAVVHATTHCALRVACDRIKQDRVLQCVRLGHEALRRIGCEQPRIAVAGLNPHSGEAGLFGTEDRDEIAPAVMAAAAEGIRVEGPVAPDTVFLKALKGQYDLVVAMYHDQGHIPMKLVAFDSGVNVTLGLPIIRTSVDHGTAFDIAGKGIADAQSMLAAISLAKRLTGQGH